MNQKRIRDWGIVIGEMAPGPRNRITDVPGVRVGHATLDDEYHKTGVTVILPADDNLFAHKLIAAAHVINGFGKTTGTIQLDELGTLETPIALTSTLNVGRISDALVEYTLDRCAGDGVKCRSVNPVVGETNDSVLNRAGDRPLGKQHLLEAMSSADVDFAEGDVGAGKGTRCLGLKGGIGSASRQMELGGRVYTLGALVQSNFGRLEDLCIRGYPAGHIIHKLQAAADVAPPTPAVPADPAEDLTRDNGSCMMVIATDLPVDHLQLTRILRRAVVGLVRVGSYIGHGSGDVVLGFTTQNRMPPSRDALRTLQVLNDDLMDTAFRAAAEAVEEALLNSLCTADTVRGHNNGGDDITVPGLPEYLPAILDAMAGSGRV